MSSKSLRRSIDDALIQQCGSHGFSFETLGDDPDELWFCRRVPELPESVWHCVAAYFTPLRDGGFQIGGHAYIRSTVVGRFMADLPAAARLDSSSPGSEIENYIDHLGFGQIVQPENPSLTFRIFDENDLGRGVSGYLDHLGGPVSRWFAERDSIDKLIALSKNSRLRRKPEAVVPQPLRATVVVLLSEQRTVEAAALMDWYLAREHFHFRDSLERVRAFELVLRERFPEYAEIRNG